MKRKKRIAAKRGHNAKGSAQAARPIVVGFSGSCTVCAFLRQLLSFFAWFAYFAVQPKNNSGQHLLARDTGPFVRPRVRSNLLGG